MSRSPPDDDQYGDRYPSDSSRRRFVKGVVGGAGLSTVGASGALVVNAATADRGSGGGATRYRGARNTDGPAPRAMPQVPLERDDEGFLRGVWPEMTTVEQGGVETTVARQDIAGVTYSRRWFQYCGVQNYPGLALEERDDYLRFVEQPPARYAWQGEKEPGARLHLDDLSGYREWGNGIGEAGVGKPARVRWRSEDLPDEQSDLVLPVFVVRSERVREQAREDDWLAATTVEGTVAFLNKCTHYCCIPGYKQTPGSAKFDAADELYCGCHQSVYDPFDVVERVFKALPRREDA
jgi:Rieske Fe-S protein